MARKIIQIIHYPGENVPLTMSGVPTYYPATVLALCDDGALFMWDREPRAWARWVAIPQDPPAGIPQIGELDE